MEPLYNGLRGATWNYMAGLTPQILEIQKLSKITFGLCLKKHCIPKDYLL